ncbi:hypothetical protein CPC08DRAFT_824809 [Agrocybe pediades]|nr:hypothetical protein CPC08DRAFT_824809 [Agrocybe pediades]
MSLLTRKTTTTVKNDDQFYSTGKYVVLQAENTRFRLPSEILTRKSQFFADMFTLPVPASSETAEGASDEKPIMLPASISAESFRSLLKMLYSSATFFGTSIEGVPVVLDKSEWISVLKLSTMWYFLECRKTVILKLTDVLGPIEKVCLGREQNVAFWIQEGYKALVERAETITDDEALSLKKNSGVDYAVTGLALLRIREKKALKGTRHDLHFIARLIEQEFSEELRTTMEAEKVYGIVKDLEPIDEVWPAKVPKDLFSDW